MKLPWRHPDASSTPAADADEATRLTTIRLEVETVAKAKALERIDPTAIPVLAGMAAEPTPPAIVQVIERGYRSLDDARRDAAEYLLADSHDRWNRTYKARCTDAATRLGIGSYNTFRDRKTADGLSHLDRLLGHVAEAIAADQRTSQSVARTPSGASRPPWRRFAVAGTIAAAAVALIAITVQEDDETPASATPNLGMQVDGCDIPVAGSTNPSAVPDELEPIMATLFVDLGAAQRIGCPQHGAQQWQDLWIQHLTGGTERPRGFLVADLNQSRAFWVEWSIIDNYRTVLNGQLQHEGGLPVSAGELDGHHILNLAKGGLLIAHQPGGPAFWIPAEAVEIWRLSGGPAGTLGLPMTDVRFEDGRPHQDYEHGYINEGEPRKATAHTTTTADVEAHLAGIGPFDEGIVRSIDGTAWWIDSSGERHWIPDGGVWNCLGGDSVVIDYEAPGWVIGAFSAADNASCG